MAAAAQMLEGAASGDLRSASVPMPRGQRANNDFNSIVSLSLVSFYREGLNKV